MKFTNSFGIGLLILVGVISLAGTSDTMENGRYKLYITQPASKDSWQPNYMVDSKTGRMWIYNLGTHDMLSLNPVAYESIDGHMFLTPHSESSDDLIVINNSKQKQQINPSTQGITNYPGLNTSH